MRRAGQQLVLVVVRLGRERAQVGDRRGVDEARARQLGLERQRAELVGDRVAERCAAVRDRRLDAASSGASPPAQRSTLPRIQTAGSSSRSRATVSAGQAPNSA